MKIGSKIHCLKLLALLLCACLPASRAMAQQPPPAQFANAWVNADERKADGNPWRGGTVFGGLGPLSPQLPLKSAPSLILCLVSEAGELSCPGPLDNRGRPASPCVLSRDCDFRHIELPPGEIFGVLIISPGLVYVNLVDGLVLTRNDEVTEDDQSYIDLNARLHAFAERLAASGSPEEYRRRSRPFQLKPLGECGVSPCRLRQSEFLLKLVRKK